MKRSISGFTIIEIVIIIVVISILASITIVAYNGITDRAKTSQTVNATNQWLKALMQYRTRNGGFPNHNGCLGANYPYGPDATSTNTGSGFQCLESASGTNVSDNPSLNTTLAPYISNQPTPAFVTAQTAANNWNRGIAYWNDSGNARLDIAFSSNVNECPSFNSGSLTGTRTVFGNKNVSCRYVLGPISGY